ncbi:MAG: biotin-dependent carboxyltransferase family protein [Saprospiraceae bacterium]
MHETILKVIKPGIYCALQDSGRFGYMHLGVPISGAMDRHSMIYLNHRLGNIPELGVLEIYGSGTSLEILAKCTLFWTGAQADIMIDGQLVTTQDPITLSSGNIISIGKIHHGARLYLGVRDGFTSDPIMESISTLHNTHLRPYVKGDIIHKNVGTSQVKNTTTRISPIRIDTRTKVHVYQGPEFGTLQETSLKILSDEPFYISNDSNRMGFRLSGVNLSRKTETQMLTSAVQPGTVQLLPNGQLIVLMRDCQTTGGYPRILQLSESSISQLAQKMPGDGVSFEVV